MKYSSILLAVLAISPALAADVNVDTLTAQCNQSTGQYMVWLGQAQGEIISLKAELAKTKAALDQAKKPDENKK